MESIMSGTRIAMPAGTLDSEKVSQRDVLERSVALTMRNASFDSAIGLLPTDEEMEGVKDIEESRISVLPFPEYDDVICVVGVGYVGEMLLREFGSVYKAIGFDISAQRVHALRAQFDSLPNVQLTTSPTEFSRATHFLISVPTLLRPNDIVDTSHLLRAVKAVTSHARPGSTIVIESSVSIGTTRKILSPYLSKFRCGMSPERVDPGRVSPAPSAIPKIISGLDAPSLASIYTLYSRIFNTLVPVSVPEVAEMAKLYENCYRMINIAYVNEIADACSHHGIDVNEVVDAASTKPFGFQRFTPGLGVGGHCIPVNPHYLFANTSLPLLRKATRRMATRPMKIARTFHRSIVVKLKDALHSPIGSKPRVLIVGIAFKPGQRTPSQSPALAFAQALKKLGCADLAFYDPLVDAERVPGVRKLEAKEFHRAGVDKRFDAVAVCLRQSRVDFRVLDGLERAMVQWF